MARTDLDLSGQSFYVNMISLHGTSHLILLGAMLSFNSHRNTGVSEVILHFHGHTTITVLAWHLMIWLEMVYIYASCRVHPSLSYDQKIRTQEKLVSWNILCLPCQVLRLIIDHNYNGIMAASRSSLIFIVDKWLLSNLRYSSCSSMINAVDPWV